MRQLLDRAFRSLIVIGTLHVEWPDGTHSVFRGKQPGPDVGVVFKNDRAVRRIARNPSMAMGECYMDGSFALAAGTSLYDFVDVLFQCMGAGGRHPAEAVTELVGRLTKPLAQFNYAWRSRRNVAHHYDLNGQLYAMLLDPDMNYSCAYFPTGRETLAEAQQAKQHHIARKLLLDRPGLEVLDIGCGWGGLAMTLARDYGAKVTGVTLSVEQLTRARERAAEAGLADRVRFELIDYRSVRGTFDRVVSVGMFEHVGRPQYPTFFRTVQRLLAPGGIALLHSIGRSSGPGATNPWLRKYIFPGGYSPALSEVLPSLERSGLLMTDLEILRLHYAETLRLWRQNFDRHRAAIQAMYDAAFVRMFELYLIGSELAFRRQDHMVFQIQLTKHPVQVPHSRRYLYEVSTDIHSHPQDDALTQAAKSVYAADRHEHDRQSAAARDIPASSALEPTGGTGPVGGIARE